MLRSIAVCAAGPLSELFRVNRSRVRLNAFVNRDLYVGQSRNAKSKGDRQELK